MKILAIETSCDETAAAVIEDGTKIISNALASSASLNKKWGGVVPEVAARQQLAYILPVIKEALSYFGDFNKSSMKQYIIDNIDAIAVTVGPGLIGSLLIGVETAKTIAMATGKPIIPVNHVIAHMYANFLEESGSDLEKSEGLTPPRTITLPAISLVVSGGHTELYLMKSIKELKWLGGTLDDAAGEAFDKSARLLGFGTGGGLTIEKAAKQFIVNSSRFTVKLPRPMMYDDSLNFSFSGLKTAIIREWTKYSSSVIPANAGIHPDGSPIESGMTKEEFVNAFAHEIQEAVTDVLVAKTIKAAQLHNAKSILLSGGVAANSRLREKFQSAIHDKRLTISFFAPPPSLCTDNAVYIASYAFFRGKPIPWQDISAVPDLSVEIDK